MFNELDLEQEQQEESISAASEHGKNSPKETLQKKDVMSPKQQGNSRAYRISVLKRDAPDIAEKVIA